MLYSFLLLTLNLLGQAHGRSFYIIGDSLTSDWMINVDKDMETPFYRNIKIAGWGGYLSDFTTWGVKNAARNGMSARSFLQHFDRNLKNGESNCAFPASNDTIGDVFETGICHKLDKNDVVVLMLGINDRCHETKWNIATCSACKAKICTPTQPILASGESGPIASYKANMHTIIRKLREKAPHITILISTHIPIIDGDEGKITYNGFYESMKIVVREAKSNHTNIHFVDLTSIALKFINLFKIRTQYMNTFHALSDYVNEKTKGKNAQRDMHPNVYGARMYAALYACALKLSNFKDEFLNENGKKLNCYKLARNLEHPALKIPDQYKIDKAGKIQITKPAIVVSNGKLGEYFHQCYHMEGFCPRTLEETNSGQSDLVLSEGYGEAEREPEPPNLKE